MATVSQQIRLLLALAMTVDRTSIALENVALVMIMVSTCRPYKVCSDLNSQPKRPGDLDLWPFDLESGVRVSVTWATSVPILVFLGLSVLESGPMYATDVRRQTDRQTSDVRQKHRLMHPPTRGGHNNNNMRLIWHDNRTLIQPTLRLKNEKLQY